MTVVNNAPHESQFKLTKDLMSEVWVSAVRIGEDLVRDNGSTLYLVKIGHVITEPQFLYSDITCHGASNH